VTGILGTQRASESLALRFGGRLSDLPACERQALFERAVRESPAVREETARIVSDVRAAGDAALRRMASIFDGVTMDALEVPASVVRAALDAIEPGVRRALERAARNIRIVHSASLPVPVEVEPEPGVIVGRRPDPLSRVGVYAPGGRGRYPSSVLMGAIPAKVAGVREIVLCSPPGESGVPSNEILAAACLAEVDRVFAIGGAGAIAAMALGTESVPRVDRIVGPGNAFVASAKLQLVGEVAIDCPAGPSEILVIADRTSDAECVAAEMIAQAEHDPDACAIALVVGDGVANEIESALARQVGGAARREIIARALAARGGVIRVPDCATAIGFSNDFAPEHLFLAIDDARVLLPSVRSAGTVFVGQSASVTFGDYLTGANHVLPTGGAGRGFSGLSTLDFFRWTTYQRVDRTAAASLAGDVVLLANAEGLPGHGLAAERWTAVR
jgi:histidinol dehydrogenase